MKMYLVVNGIPEVLKSHSVPINFDHDLCLDKGRSGHLQLINIQTTTNIDEKTNINIMINSSIVKLGTPSQVKCVNNLITLIFRFDDVFDIYKEFISVIDNNDLYVIHSAFDTISVCNLKCPYCCMSMNEREPNYDETDFYLTQLKLDEIYTMWNEKFSYNLHTKYHRYMGGEPFINATMFRDYTNFFSKNKKWNTDRFKDVIFQTYTNCTIRDSIKNTLIPVIKDKLYNEYEIWITIDSIDYEKSVRFNSMEDSINFLNNIKSLPKEKNVHVYFNIMYISDDIFIDTVLWLQSQGYFEYEIAFNDDNYDDKYNAFRENKRKELINLEIMKDSKLVKDHHYYLIPIFFSIREFGRAVAIISSTFKSDWNVCRVYK